MASFPDSKLRNGEGTFRGRNFFLDIVGFAIFFIVALVAYMGVGWVLNYRTTSDLSFWIEIGFYIILFGAFVVWARGIRKLPLRPFFLARPRWPAPGHQWFYILWTSLWVYVVVVLLVLVGQGLIVFSIDATVIMAFIYACVEAPIVEEIVFRGYIYTRAESVWKRSWRFAWKMKEINSRTGAFHSKSIMTFEITYTALVSSVIFGIYHMSPFQSVFTFIGGLIFCKARREWGGTLIVPMLLHSSWNFFSGISFLVFQLDTVLFFVVVGTFLGIALVIVIITIVSSYLSASKIRWIDQLRATVVDERVRPYISTLQRNGAVSEDNALKVTELMGEFTTFVGQFIDRATPESLASYYLTSLELSNPELPTLIPPLLGRRYKTTEQLHMFWDEIPSAERDASVHFWEEEAATRTEQALRILGQVDSICDSVSILRQVNESFSIPRIASELTGVLDLMTGSDAFDNLTTFPDLARNLGNTE